MRVRENVQTDDAWWCLNRAKKEATLVDPLKGPPGEDDVDVPMPVRTGKKGKKSAFEMLEDFQAGVKDEDEDDAPGGGLMVCFGHPLTVYRGTGWPQPVS